MVRLRSIDFLRGIAVILVLFRHHEFIRPLYNAGWIGVDLFFVLSGYLVSMLLFKEFFKRGKIQPFKFLIRRGFKIYPLFYTAILLTVIIEFLKGNGVNRYNLLSEVLFVQNYFGSMWNHTWSLAIEEHFYIGLALFLFFIIRFNLFKHRRYIILGFIFIFLTCLILRFQNFKIVYSFQTHLFPTHLRIDSLLFGVLLSYLHNFYKDRFEKYILSNKKLLFVSSMICIVPAFVLKVNTWFMSTIGLSLLYLGFGLIFVVLLIEPKTNFYLDKYLGKFITDMVAKVGFYSYGIYLFHMFVRRYGLSWMHDLGFNFNYRIEFAIYFILSILFGVILSLVIEKPFLVLRDKIVPR